MRVIGDKTDNKVSWRKAAADLTFIRILRNYRI